MKVLLLGATGNLGCRLVPALLTHNHQVVAYVRSTSKLQSLLPAATLARINVIEGDAKDSAAITRAIIENDCDAVLNTAGQAVPAPWSTSDFPVLFRAVVDAARAAGKEKGRPLRLWCLGGMTALYYPGSVTPIVRYFPAFTEHLKNIALLRDLPAETLDWSMLCPAYMAPGSTIFDVPTKRDSAPLIAAPDTVPRWPGSFLTYIPFIGKTLALLVNFNYYQTTLEQAAEFIADDLENRGSSFIGRAVGIVDSTR